MNQYDIGKLLCDTKITPGPWYYRYTSAQAAQDYSNGTDGGGASGSIYAKTGEQAWGVDLTNVIAFLPNHRDVLEDEEREANAAMMAGAPDLFAALLDLLILSDHADETGYMEDVGFMDREAIHERAYAALIKCHNRARKCYDKTG